MSAIEPLSGKPQFRRVYATGRRSTRDGVTAIVRLRDDGPPRLGLAVGRAAGQAVVRNKIRRRLRHAFRAYGPAPADVILIGRAPLYSAPYSRVEEYVNSCLASAGLPGGAS